MAVPGTSFKIGSATSHQDIIDSKYTYSQPLDYFLDLGRCVPSRLDFRAFIYFATLTAIDFLLREAAGFRSRIEELRSRGSWSSNTNMPNSGGSLLSLRLVNTPRRLIL